MKQQAMNACGTIGLFHIILNCLSDQNPIGKMNETSKRIKKSILTYFPIRECITLVRPADEAICIMLIEW